MSSDDLFAAEEQVIAAAQQLVDSGGIADAGDRKLYAELLKDYQKTRVQKNVDLQAAAEEIGRVSRQSLVDVGGPVIRLEGLEEDRPKPSLGGLDTGAE